LPVLCTQGDRRTRDEEERGKGGKWGRGEALIRERQVGNTGGELDRNKYRVRLRSWVEEDKVRIRNRVCVDQEEEKGR
jgi:hypothetical protein